MTKCIVLSTQRSGSTFLVDYLSAGSTVRIHSELFQNLNPKLVGRPDRPAHYDIAFETYRNASLRRRIAHFVRRRALIERYLGEVFAAEPEFDVLGFKLMYNQVDKYPALWSWVRANRVKVVHLIRRNLLNVIVSRALAAKRGTHSMLKTFERQPVHVDTDRLVSRLSRIDNDVERFRSACASLPYCEASYEGFVADKQGEAQRLLDFLGVSQREPLASKLKKTNPHRLDETIENYSDVVRTLEGTRFAAFLS